MYRIRVNGDNGVTTLVQRYSDLGEAVRQARQWKRAHAGRWAQIVDRSGAHVVIDDSTQGFV